MVSVLHVTECYGGGVGRAIRTIAKLTPQHQHHLLWAGEEAPEGDLFASATRFQGGFWARIWQVRQISRSIQPQVVHAHSSWAGAYVRLLPLRPFVIYQPHCYAFDSPYINEKLRTVYRLAEKYFGVRTSLVIGLCKSELDSAMSLSPTTPAVLLPNVASIRPEHAIVRQAPRAGQDITIVMSGRICPQKDPIFFGQVADMVFRQCRHTRFVWIGDGEPGTRRKLERAGIHVTGWLPDERLAEALVDATVYFHSAVHEGFPISVLDAAAFNLPIVVRDIPAFDSVDLDKGHNPEDCASKILSLITDISCWTRAMVRSARLDSLMNPTTQARLLDSIYKGKARVNPC
jgi:glycosyltransferase involved in cell wall biosynthesis